MSNVELQISTQVNLMRADVYAGTAEMPLPPHHQVFVAAIAAGLPLFDAAARAGIPPFEARELANAAHVKEYVVKYRQQFSRQVRFGLEDAHYMYMKAYHGSANATEQIKATDALVKLHRLNDTPKEKDEKEVTASHVERMDMRQLLHLAQIGLDSITPEDKTTVVEHDDGHEPRAEH